MTNLNFLSPKLRKLFKDYIELDTSLDSGENYPQAIKILADFLAAQNFHTAIYPIPKDVCSKPNRSHLVATRNINVNLPTILIYSHIDVVPASYENCFKFNVVNDRVCGRGAADQKGGTIGILSALENLANQSLKYNLIFWATTDEETDQLNQLNYLKSKLNLPSNVIIFDPDTFAGGITVGNLGLAQYELIVNGKSSHSGMSHLGVNAVEQAGYLITHFLKSEKTRAEQVHSQLKTFPSLGNAPVCSRVNVNLINGGTAANVVPSQCRLVVDCRYIPEANVETESENFQARLATFCQQNQINLQINRKQLIMGGFCEHEFKDQLNHIYSSLTNESGFYCAMGSTPLAHFATINHLPHLGLGVIRADSNIHADNESVLISDIYNLSKTLQTILVN